MKWENLGGRRKEEREAETNNRMRAGPGSDGSFLIMPICTLSSHHNVTLQPSNKTPSTPISDPASVRDTSNQGQWPSKPCVWFKPHPTPPHLREEKCPSLQGEIPLLHQRIFLLSWKIFVLGFFLPYFCSLSVNSSVQSQTPHNIWNLLFLLWCLMRFLL